MFHRLQKRKAKSNLVKNPEIITSTGVVRDGMYEKCAACGQLIALPDLQSNAWVCTSCTHPFRLHPAGRAKLIFDKMEVFAHTMTSKDPLNFPGYTDKLKSLSEYTGMNDAVVCARAKLEDKEVIAVIMDSSFMMGSMGSVVGEKITRAFEVATKEKKAILIFCASGGARMQEGIISLMQMAKVSAAIQKYHEKGGLYISILTDPTTGGVTASFASLGDIILAEPGALIGFAGPRVIEQTIKKPLPEGFQKSEFLLEHGFIDKIVKRHELKQTLFDILELHGV